MKTKQEMQAFIVKELDRVGITLLSDSLVIFATIMYLTGGLDAIQDELARNKKTRTALAAVRRKS